MTHVSLFTGIGGLDLAAEWAGFETILQVEMDDYANKVLQKHWPDVKRAKDIRNVTRDTVTRSVTVVSGGFPCQPFSQAGKRGGREDDRYLWPEMLRVIRELSPTWVVGENVSGLLSINEGMEIESIISQMESEGYEVCPLHYPAAGVGAPHRRDRVFIVAYSKRGRCRQSREGGELGAIRQEQQNNAGTIEKPGNVADTDLDRQQAGGLSIRSGGQDETSSQFARDGENVANSNSLRMEGQGAKQQATGIDKRIRYNRWTVEPDVGRVADGIPARMDRLKCLGNAVVPQQAYPIFKAIAEVINEELETETYGRDSQTYKQS